MNLARELWRTIRAFVREEVAAQLSDAHTPASTTTVVQTGGTPVYHLHDDRYYTEGEVDALLAGYSTTAHDHDSAYLALSGGTLSGALTVDSQSAGDATVTVQAAASQTAPLTRWEDSTGTTLAEITPDGFDLYPQSGTEGAKFYGLGSYASTWVKVLTNTNGAGTFASNGTAFTFSTRPSSESSAHIRFYPKTSSNAIVHLDSGAFVITNYNDASELWLRVGTSLGTIATSYDATVEALRVRGAASATADIQQWQDSSLTTLLAVGAGGELRFAEMTAPSAPAANNAALFAQDNGSGKTQLCVRFATGATQVLATEP